MKNATYLLMGVAAMNFVALGYWLRWYWSREARFNCCRAIFLTLVGYVILLLGKCISSPSLSHIDEAELAWMILCVVAYMYFFRVAAQFSMTN